MSDKETNEKSIRRDTWLRGGFILIFAFIYAISKIIIWSLVIFQFFSLLITGKLNSHLARFSQSLSVFVYQLLQYVMFNSDEKPFPFADWPASTTSIVAQEVVSKKKTARKTARKKKVVTKKEE